MQVEELTNAKEEDQGSDQIADQCKTTIEELNNIEEEVTEEDQESVQDTNQEIVKKIKNNQRAYDITSKSSQILSLKHRIEQLQHIEAPLEKAQVQKLRPAAVSFADYSSGLRESVQRLNPSKNYRTNARE